jgi:hypothetical protein
MSMATHRAEQQAERNGGKSAERKTFQHFVHGDQQSAEAEADEHPIHTVMGCNSRQIPRSWLMAYPPSCKGSRNKMRMAQSGVMVQCLNFCYSFVPGGLCDHKMPHKPCRFKLLVVTADCWRWPARWSRVVHFEAIVPASPLPDFKSTIKFSTFRSRTLCSSRHGNFRAVRRQQHVGRSRPAG